MRERAFIEQNKEKWIKFEKEIKDIQSIDQIIDSYTQLKNDLSFAQTYYPKSKLTAYLNELAMRAHLEVYSVKKDKKSSILNLWLYDVPKILILKKQYLYLSFFFFVSFVCIGIISSIYDESFVRMILSDDYVDQTIENINNGDPLAIYATGSNWGTSIAIIFNNIQVGLYSYVMGIFGGLGTLWVLLQNGIMLGSFQYFFYQNDVFIESLSGIWIHGAMEIFAIVIEGAAGLILGTSFLFPGTYSRMASFKKGVSTSLKVVVSTIPFTIAAGILEGFITRYYNEMPMFLAFTIVFLTLGVIVYYYLVYPFRLEKKIKQYNHEII